MGTSEIPIDYVWYNQWYPRLSFMLLVMGLGFFLLGLPIVCSVLLGVVFCLDFIRSFLLFVSLVLLLGVIHLFIYLFRIFSPTPNSFIYLFLKCWGFSLSQRMDQWVRVGYKGPLTLVSSHGVLRKKNQRTRQKILP